MKILLFVQSACAPCRQVKPSIKSLADTHNVELVLCDVTDNWPLCQEWQVVRTPTAFIIGDGVQRVDYQNPVQMINDIAKEIEGL